MRIRICFWALVVLAVAWARAADAASYTCACDNTECCGPPNCAEGECCGYEVGLGCVADDFGATQCLPAAGGMCGTWNDSYGNVVTCTEACASGDSCTNNHCCPNGEVFQITSQVCCTPEPAAQVCAAHASSCLCSSGSSCQVVDNCSDLLTCACCSPQTAAQACGGATCGSAVDGCGGTVSCGPACASTGPAAPALPSGMLGGLGVLLGAAGLSLTRRRSGAKGAGLFALMASLAAAGDARGQSPGGAISVALADAGAPAGNDTLCCSWSSSGDCTAQLGACPAADVSLSEWAPGTDECGSMFNEPGAGAYAVVGCAAVTSGSGDVSAGSCNPPGPLFAHQLFSGEQITIGADPTLYTVTAIASDSSLTIAPPYAGSSNGNTSLSVPCDEFAASYPIGVDAHVAWVTTGPRIGVCLDAPSAADPMHEEPTEPIGCIELSLAPGLGVTAETVNVPFDVSAFDAYQICYGAPDAAGSCGNVNDQGALLELTPSSGSCCYGATLLDAARDLSPAAPGDWLIEVTQDVPGSPPPVVWYASDGGVTWTSMTAEYARIVPPDAGCMAAFGEPASCGAPIASGPLPWADPPAPAAACTPATCPAAACGTLTNGCGGAIDCGDCSKYAAGALSCSAGAARPSACGAWPAGALLALSLVLVGRKRQRSR